MAIGTTRLAALKRTWRQEKEGEDSSEGRDEQGTYNYYPSDNAVIYRQIAQCLRKFKCRGYRGNVDRSLPSQNNGYTKNPFTESSYVYIVLEYIYIYIVLMSMHGLLYIPSRQIVRVKACRLYIDGIKTAYNANFDTLYSTKLKLKKIANSMYTARI